jgi:hypothetical protein
MDFRNNKILKIKKYVIKVLFWLAIIVADFFVFAILSFSLMGYEDFYDSSKGELWSLASMNLTEKILYICFCAWQILNIIVFVFIIGRIIYKRIKHIKSTNNQITKSTTST